MTDGRAAQYRSDHTEGLITKSQGTALRLTGIFLVLATSIGGAYLAHRFIEDMTDPTRPATLAGVLLTSVPVFLAWAFMKLLGRTWGDYGLKLAPLWKTVGLGIAIAAVLHMLVLFVLAPLIYRIAPDPPDISHLTGIRGDPAAFLFVMLVVWITAALFEELVFRGFLLNEMATLLGRSTVGWIGAALFIAVTFGLGHAYQGLFGILITGSIGLLLAIAYLLVGRNLLPLILAHGLIDTYSISMLYLS